MITKKVKCQNCNFEQFVQTDAKECICGKCGYKIQISNENSYFIKKNTIGELNTENQNKRNKYRKISRFLTVIGIFLTIFMFTFGKNVNVLIMFLVDFSIAICFLSSLFLSILSGGKDSTESLIEEATNKNPNMSLEEFENEYSQELYEIEKDKEERKERMRESQEKRREENIIRNAEMKEQKERLEKEHNFQIAKDKYAYYAGELAKPYRNKEYDSYKAKGMAEAEADMHKYSN